jgi:hypothetical protein
VADGGNGHAYEAVLASTTWTEANAAAMLTGGHLATIHSAAENAFVFNLFDSQPYWISFNNNGNWGPWIGGFQRPGSMEPAGGWEWVTGEPLSYTNWRAGEPNNEISAGFSENHMQFFSGPGTRANTWNDFFDHPSLRMNSYVVEYIPEPATLALTVMILAVVVPCMTVRSCSRIRRFTDSAISFVALGLIGSSTAFGQLVAVTDTQLVAIDTTSLNITTIGMLGLPSNWEPSGLAYDPSTNALYTIAGIQATTNHGLFRINPATGQATQIANLAPRVRGTFEGFEYVDSLAALFVTDNFDGYKMLPFDGTVMTLFTSSPQDKDFLGYDSTRDRLYGHDPNNGSQLFLINASTGTTQNLGPTPMQLGDLAYSPSADAFFGVSWVNTNFYRVTLTEGMSPITVTTLGQLPGSGYVYKGLAVIPEPSTLVLMAISALALFAYAQTRRPLRA